MGFQEFERKGYSSHQENKLSQEEEQGLSFEDRAQKLRGFARTKLEKDDAFATFTSHLSSKYGKEVPEEVCNEIAESASGSKFFHEGPMVLAAILELRLMRRG